MAYEFDNKIPIYVQIMNIIKHQIISKQVLPDQRLPSVRDYSEMFGANPNTIQKALSELEREGLIVTERTMGKFITKDAEKIATIRSKVAVEKSEKFTREMLSLGFTLDEIKSFIK